MTTDNPTDERSATRRPGEWLALGLMVLVGLFPYGASGLMVPPSGLVVLAAVWIGLFVFLWRWRPGNQWLALVVPLVAVAAWFAILSLGDALLGWTA